jgi:heme A synthase
MYAVFLYCHSYVRWAVVALLVTVVALRLVRKEPADARLHRVLLGVVNLQLALGLLLYLIYSPISSAFFRDPAHGFDDPNLRFFGLEHPLTMLVAIAVLHVGRVLAKKATDATVARRRLTVSTVVCLVFVGLAMPWPWLDSGRPLFRLPAPSSSGGASR